MRIPSVFEKLKTGNKVFGYILVILIYTGCSGESDVEDAGTIYLPFENYSEMGALDKNYHLCAIKHDKDEVVERVVVSIDGKVVAEDFFESEHKHGAVLGDFFLIHPENEGKGIVLNDLSIGEHFIEIKTKSNMNESTSQRWIRILPGKTDESYQGIKLM